MKLSSRTGPTTEPRGTPPVPSLQMDLIPFTTTLWAQLSGHFLTQQAMNSQLLQDNVVGNGVKGFTKA